MNTLHKAPCLRALVLAAFLSAIGPIGAAAQSAAQLENERELAGQGDAIGQSNLGMMYHLGKGVPQNHKLAAQWFRKAAEQGDANVQYYLGVMYDQGKGVPQNQKLAAQWFRKAAEQGYAHAQNTLGLMYSNGEGVMQDYVQAQKWFNLAATENAKYRANRNQHAEQMTPAQIAEAQKMAREWKPKP
jgi:TPR repeat protein